jgi:hypothetical protein
MVVTVSCDLRGSTRAIQCSLKYREIGYSKLNAPNERTTSALDAALCHKSGAYIQTCIHTNIV